MILDIAIAVVTIAAIGMLWYIWANRSTGRSVPRPRVEPVERIGRRRAGEQQWRGQNRR